MAKSEKNIPAEIKARFDEVNDEVESILKNAEVSDKTKIRLPIRVKFHSRAPKDVLTTDESAQVLSFVARYENLPVIQQADVEEKNGKFFLRNISFIRHILNEYRSIIQNQRDSVYYSTINKFCRSKLINRDDTKDTVITIESKADGDVSLLFAKFLDEQCKSIRHILKHCEFGYIYNGILQHSDHRFTERFIEDYISGRINYIFVKHALILNHVRDSLYWHHKLLNYLKWPKLGPL